MDNKVEAERMAAINKAMGTLNSQLGEDDEDFKNKFDVFISLIPLIFENDGFALIFLRSADKGTDGLACAIGELPGPTIVRRLLEQLAEISEKMGCPVSVREMPAHVDSNGKEICH